MAGSRIVCGAGVIAYVNGQVFAKATDFEWTSLTPRKRVRGVDILLPLELIPVSVEVSFRCSMVKISGDGGNQAAGIVAQQAHLSREKYFTFALVDRRSGTTLFSSNYNACEAETWRVGAKGTLIGSVSCCGLLWTGEASDATPAQ
jgi:hypothetical protein